MFRQSGYSRAMSADLTEIERRLRTLEKQLERVGGRASATATQAADRIGDAVVSALGEIGDRFRGGTRAVSDEAVKFGGEAAKLGDKALRRLAHEVEHRPLVTLAVAAGVGLLVGLAMHRR